MLFSFVRARIWAWFQAYDNVQFLAVVLLYIQVGCSLIGSLGVSYTGLLIANLAIALYALVAIESGSQALGRTYAAFLGCAVLLDITWFILFAVEIRQVPPNVSIGKFTAFSLQLVLWMQIGGFLVRFVSILLWIQIYRLGLDHGGAYQMVDVEGRHGGFGFFSPVSSPHTSRQPSLTDEVLSGSIYKPSYFSNLFSSVEEGHSIKENGGGALLSSDQTTSVVNEVAV